MQHRYAPLVCAVASTSDQPSLFALTLLHDATRDETGSSNLRMPIPMAIRTFSSFRCGRLRHRAYFEVERTNNLSTPLSHIYVVAGGCERKSEAGHMKRA